ncbi:MAG: hypothetical protein BVN35_18385 [Proteobacteria bacterium ST_bin11]|nr:MAG: hypothetical protein BVN35_18385 [Proteobacteria bacterium ST_bin11]
MSDAISARPIPLGITDGLISFAGGLRAYEALDRQLALIWNRQKNAIMMIDLAPLAECGQVRSDLSSLCGG